MIALEGEDAKQAESASGKAPVVIEIGSKTFIPLQLEAATLMGQIENRLYDPAKKSWSSTIALRRYP